jgi:hypothetical protein
MICLYDDRFDLALPVNNGAGYMGYAHCPGDSARRAEFDRCGFIYTLHHDSRCRVRRISSFDHEDGDRILPTIAHFARARFLSVRCVLYTAVVSATRIPASFFSGSKVTRTRACRALATRRRVLREWPS